MGGKSTFLRQNALIVVLAQAGGFVPAAAVKLGLVDRLFSRVGASDNLARGRSTFMVEMVETAAILAQARSEEHTTELQSLMRIPYAVFCLKKKKKQRTKQVVPHTHKSNSNEV